MSQQGLVEQGINQATYLPNSFVPKLVEDLKPKSKMFSGVPLQPMNTDSFIDPPSQMANPIDFYQM